MQHTAKADALKTLEYDPQRLGKGWDEIRIGDRVTHYPTHSTEITRKMVHEFAALTGDFNPVHVDDQFAARSVHRRPIAHGALLISLVIGDYHRTEYTYGTTLALLQTRTRFLRPAYFGDIVYSEFEVVAKEPNPHPKRGQVTYRAQLRRVADHEPLIELEYDVLIRRIRGVSARRRLGIDGKRASGQPDRTSIGRTEVVNEAAIVTRAGKPAPSHPE